jgi:hypothetical protein
LLRFAHKTSKNRRLGDFLPCKLRKEPVYRGFYGFFLLKKAIKTYKYNRLPGEKANKGEEHSLVRFFALAVGTSELRLACFLSLILSIHEVVACLFALLQVY